jgi:uncharacterized protein (DUF58 family)
VASPGTALSAYGAVLDGVRGVRWTPRRRVAGGPTGSHRSKRRGLGAEFTEYRAYRQGDDPRQLDWKLLARTDRAYVRLAEEQAILPTVLVVDASASMAYPAPGLDKWIRACTMVVGLAAVAHGSGDPVGMVAATNDGSVTVEPRTRRGIVAEMALALAEVSPRGTQPLTSAVTAARALLRQGGRMVVVSDFLNDAVPGDAATVLATAGELMASGGECLAVHIVAREELDPPWRRALVADPEQPAVRRPLTGPTRAAYVSRFAAWREELSRTWRATGAGYALVATDDSPVLAVRQIAAGIVG